MQKASRIKKVLTEFEESYREALNHEDKIFVRLTAPDLRAHPSLLTVHYAAQDIVRQA